MSNGLPVSLLRLMALHVSDWNKRIDCTSRLGVMGSIGVDREEE